MKSKQNVEGKSLSIMTRFVLLLGIPLGAFMTYSLLSLALRDDPDPLLKWIFFGPLLLLCISLTIAGFWGLVATTRIDDEGISYFGFKKHRISWDNIKNFSYPHHSSGLTVYGKIELKKGKPKILPFGSGKLSQAANEISVNFLMKQDSTKQQH